VLSLRSTGWFWTGDDVEGTPRLVACCISSIVSPFYRRRVDGIPCINVEESLGQMGHRRLLGMGGGADEYDWSVSFARQHWLPGFWLF